MNPLEGHATWERVRDISRGASGTVLLGRNKQTGEEAALKLIERGQKITRSVEREVSTWPQHHNLNKNYAAAAAA